MCIRDRHRTLQIMHDPDEPGGEDLLLQTLSGEHRRCQKVLPGTTRLSCAGQNQRSLNNSYFSVYLRTQNQGTVIKLRKNSYGISLYTSLVWTNRRRPADSILSNGCRLIQSKEKVVSTIPGSFNGIFPQKCKSPGWERCSTGPPGIIFCV